MQTKEMVSTDCFYFEGNKPCAFHKLDKRICKGCKDYAKIGFSLLIVKLDAVGDVLRTTSVLPGLHEKYPNVAITWITRRSAKPILDGNKLIHQVLVVEENYLEKVLQDTFDVGICLDADSLSATILSLAKCDQKYGYIVDRKGRVIPANIEAERWYLMGINDVLKVENRIKYQNHIHEICKIPYSGSKPQIYIDEVSKQRVREFMIRNNIDRFTKVIGINTGGGRRWELKKWRADYYIELLRMIEAKYPEYGILLLGGPEETEFNKSIMTNVSESVIDAGCHNSVKEFAAIINHCDVLFTADSLGMHVGTALSIYTIVLVGPTSPWELELYGNGEVIFNHSMSCIACYLNKCDKDPNCMNTITPALIFKKLESYLKR